MSAPARFATQRNPDNPTRGPAVAALAKSFGLELMPWQVQVLDVALEYDAATGNYVYDTVVITVPRQSGKSFLVGLVAEHRCLTKNNARVWYTAQTGSAASTWMKDEHHTFLSNAKALNGMYSITRALGSESVRWAQNGSTFGVFPPKRDSMHGKQSDLTFLDEVWSYDAEKGAMIKQAVRPTMATRPGSQMWVLSTKGDDASAMLADYIEAGREAVTDPKATMAYFEWSIGDHDDAEDLDLVVAAHPAVGYTITREALERARKDFGSDVSGWARAYGNRATASRTAAFPHEVWQRCGSEAPELPKRFGLAFDCTPSGDRSSVVACWTEGDDTWVEVLRDEAGTHWVADFAIEIATKYRVPIGYDTAGVQTLAVADEIVRRSRAVTTRGLTTNEFASSCASFAGKVIDGSLRHSRQKPLDKAVEVASRRPILDGGWAWGRKVSTGSITALVAATVAMRVSQDLPAARVLRVLTPKGA